MISIKFSDIVAPRKRIRYTKKEINGEKKVTMAPCFYQSNTDRVKEIDPEELTITFACSRYPREMLNHLLKVRGIHVESQDKGIYYLTGDAIPMQLLLTRELTQEENFWLKNLRMDLITRANWTEMEVERKMCDALKELFAEELKEEKMNAV